MKQRINYVAFALIPILLLGLNLYLIQGPDFLFWWDERFHALVAKNLTESFGITRLLPFEIDEVSTMVLPWGQDPIWLHKPPFFSYTEALLMKIFGVGVFQFRLASSISLLLLYYAFLKIQLFAGAHKLSSALIAAAICLNPFLLKLMIGSQGMDHNDLAFITTMSLAIWSLLALRKHQKAGLLLLFSAFVAASVLTKWLVGLLPFLLWLLLDYKKLPWKQMLLSISITALLVAPWHWFIHGQYPEKAAAALRFNGEHFWQVVENHQHPWYYHFEQWFTHFFLLIGILILFLFFRKKGEPASSHSRIASAISLLFLLLFFSFARTKLPAFTFVGLPLVTYIIGTLKTSIKLRQIASLSFLVPAMAQMAYLPFIDYEKRFPKDSYRKHFYTELDKSIAENSIILGARDLHYIEAMFYCDHWVLNQSMEKNWLETLSANGRNIYRLQYNEEGMEIGLEPVTSASAD